MGLLQTMLVIGLVLVGAAGMWKLATVFPSTRARVGAFVVYAATPLIGGAMAGGRLTVLIVYAATPWIVHFLRRAVGHRDRRSGRRRGRPHRRSHPPRPGSNGSVGSSCSDSSSRWPAAFAPIVVVVTAVLAVLLGLGNPAGARFVASRRLVRGCGLGRCRGRGGPERSRGSTTWSWSSIVGPPPLGDPGRGLLELASFEIGPTDFAALAVALFVPVIAAVALAKAWRLTWAVRAGCRRARVRRARRRRRSWMRSRSTCPRPACCSCRSPRRVDLGSGRVGGVRSRRPRWSVRVAPAARSARDDRGRDRDRARRGGDR